MFNQLRACPNFIINVTNQIIIGMLLTFFCCFPCYLFYVFSQLGAKKIRRVQEITACFAAINSEFRSREVSWVVGPETAWIQLNLDFVVKEIAQNPILPVQVPMTGPPLGSTVAYPQQMPAQGTPQPFYQAKAPQGGTQGGTQGFNQANVPQGGPPGFNPGNTPQGGFTMQIAQPVQPVYQENNMYSQEYPVQNKKVDDGSYFQPPQ